MNLVHRDEEQLRLDWLWRFHSAAYWMCIFWATKKDDRRDQESIEETLRERHAKLQDPVAEDFRKAVRILIPTWEPTREENADG